MSSRGYKGINQMILVPLKLTKVPWLNPLKIQWSMSAEPCVTSVVKNIEEQILKDVIYLCSKKYSTTRLSNGYWPELDVTPPLSPEAANLYQQYWHFWITELGRIDILFSVLLLSSFMNQLHVGHLTQALWVLVHLKHYKKASMVSDNTGV